MKISINVKENTFQKSLVKMGYNLKINQYDDFINSIRRIALRELIDAFKEGSLIKTIDKIFSNNISMSILENKDQITFITDTYLKDLIDNSSLDLYLENGKFNFRTDVQENAYRLKLINDIPFNDNFYKQDLLIVNKYSDFYDYWGNKHITVLKCINSNGIDLSEVRKEEIKEEIENNLIKTVINSMSSKILSLESTIRYFSLGEMDIEEHILIKFFKDKMKEKELLNNEIEYIHIDIDKNVLKIKRLIETMKTYSRVEIKEQIKEYREDPSKTKKKFDFSYNKKLKEMNNYYIFEEDNIFFIKENGILKGYSYNDLCDFKISQIK